MSKGLEDIISALKTVALASGFVSVEEMKININQNADTELPRMLIKLNNIDYDKFLVDSSVETYKFELYIVIADSANPISDLKTIMDTFIGNMFTENLILAQLANNGKIKFINANLSNDRDLYSKLGGESVLLRIDISNINQFGGTPC